MNIGRGTEAMAQARLGPFKAGKIAPHDNRGPFCIKLSGRLRMLPAPEAKGSHGSGSL
jgi:hypothetical protein